MARKRTISIIHELNQPNDACTLIYENFQNILYVTVCYIFLHNVMVWLWQYLHNILLFSVLLNIIYLVIVCFYIFYWITHDFEGLPLCLTSGSMHIATLSRCKGVSRIAILKTIWKSSQLSVNSLPIFCCHQEFTFSCD